MDTTGDKKKKQRPYTEYERQLLIQLVQSKIEVVENRRTDGTTQKKKNEAWEDISSNFNNSPNVSQCASVTQLKKMWQNLKTKARDAKTLDAQKKWTGGGPAPPAIGSQDSQVLAIIPSVIPTINIEVDSDVNQPSTSQLDQENDNDSMYWKNKKNRNEIEVVGEENTHSLPGWPLQEPAKQIPAAVLKKTKVEETVEDLKKELLKKEIEKVAQQILHEKEKHEIELEILKIRKDLLKKQLND